MLLDKQISEIVKVVWNVMDAFTAALFVVDHEKRAVTLREVHSLSNHVPPEVSLGFDEGLVGWIAKNRRSVNVKGFDRDTTTLGYYATNEHIKSFMGLPVHSEAVLCVDSKKSYVFTEKDLKILSGFTEVIHYALLAEKRLDEDSLHAENLSFLLGIEKLWREKSDLQSGLTRILSMFTERFKIPIAALIEVDEDKKELRLMQAVGLSTVGLTKENISRGKGLIDWVYRYRQPLIFDRFHFSPGKSYVFAEDEELHDVKSLCLLPLISNAKMLGILCLCSLQEDTFEKFTRPFLFSISDLLALFIQNEKQARVIEGLDEKDPATGMLNDLAFYSRYMECFGRSKDYGVPFSLYIFSMERERDSLFRLGRKRLQGILAHVLKTMRSILGPQAAIGRVSTASLAAMLETIEELKARELFGRLAQELSHRPFLLEGERVHVAFRLGFSLYSSEIEGPAEMWRRAAEGMQSFSLGSEREQIG